MGSPALRYSQEWRDENLRTVYAVEGFAHTQDMDETACFAEDYIEARRK
jgi:hypothetical protein